MRICSAPTAPRWIPASTTSRPWRWPCESRGSWDKEIPDRHRPRIGLSWGTVDRLHLGAVHMLKGFKEFLLRGNVVDLAVAVVMGGAFGAVVAPMRALTERLKKPEAAAPPATRKCPECLSEIPIEAKRCAHCTMAV